MLLHRLQMSYSLGGNVITWFASYLTGRTQYVWTAASRSVSLAVLFGVPQGLVLWPILPLHCWPAALVKRHVLHPHCYADDTQIYGLSDQSDVDALQERLSLCIDEVFSRMMSNRLQLISAKTGVLWCSSAWRQHQITTGPACVGDTSVLLVWTVRDLWSTLTQMSPWVLTLLQSSKRVLLHSVKYAVCVIRWHVPPCWHSSRTCGHKGGLLQLMFSARKSEHITPLLRELH